MEHSCEIYYVQLKSKTSERMGTEQAKTMKTPSLPPVLHLRARPRTGRVLGLDSPSALSTPPLRSHVTVPFLWEDAPGKPKIRGSTASGRLSRLSLTAGPPLADQDGATATAGGVQEDSTTACHVPLKLPPRLQTAATAECSLSPKTVLQGPYYGGGRKPPRPLRRSESTAGFRTKLGAAGELFSWRKAAGAPGSKKDGFDLDAAGSDASCCSPASSSSSSSMSYFFDDHSHGAHWRQADGREDSQDVELGEEGANGSVRIRRFRRNRSLPSMTTSHLLASIRRSVRQINPWS